MPVRFRTNRTASLQGILSGVMEATTTLFSRVIIAKNGTNGTVLKPLICNQGVSQAEQEKQEEIDIRNYAKYILREGKSLEKRELLSKLKSKLVIKDARVILEK